MGKIKKKLLIINIILFYIKGVCLFCVNELTMESQKTTIDGEYSIGIAFNQGVIDSEYNFGFIFEIYNLQVTGINVIGVLMNDILFQNNSYSADFGGNL